MCTDPVGFLSFCGLYAFFGSLLEKLELGFNLAWLTFGLAALTMSFVVINSLVLATAFYTWFERRALGRFQVRLGPNRWGPFGLFQPFADMIKLMTKEDTVPTEADRIVFNIAPIIFVAPALLVIAVVPFGQNSFMGSLNIGILFIIGVTSVNSIAIFMAGWASRNKYAILGSIRGVAMLISYEVPMALSIAGILLLSGSLAMSTIVAQQSVPFIFVQPLGFLVFIASASAEMSRTPFDQIEAESELGSGYNTEYSGMKFGVLFLAEFMAPIVTACIVTTLFLGGIRGFDFLPGQLWFIMKVFAVVFMLLWFRATWPRLRVDQIMIFAWKGLFGVAIFNLLLVAIEVELLRDPSTGMLSSNSLWIMAAINWATAIGVIVIMANILGQRRLRRPDPVPSPLANMSGKAD